MDIAYKTTRPTPEDFFALFATTGWNQEYQATLEELGCMLENSHFSASAYHAARLIGFGRVVTDGVLHAMIYDLIVHPDYQLQGIGAHLLQMLMHWCKASGIREIQLFCARDKRPFYEKYGFVARPEEAPGMQYRGG